MLVITTYKGITHKNEAVESNLESQKPYTPVTVASEERKEEIKNDLATAIRLLNHGELRDPHGESQKVSPFKGTIEVSNAVKRNIRTKDSLAGKECSVEIKIAENGDVLNVTQIGGHDIMCDEVIPAVYKSSPLPMPTNPIANKNLQTANLVFKQER